MKDARFYCREDAGCSYLFVYSGDGGDYCSYLYLFSHWMSELPDGHSINTELPPQAPS